MIRRKKRMLSIKMTSNQRQWSYSLISQNHLLRKWWKILLPITICSTAVLTKSQKVSGAFSTKHSQKRCFTNRSTQRNNQSRPTTEKMKKQGISHPRQVKGELHLLEGRQVDHLLQNWKRGKKLRCSSSKLKPHQGLVLWLRFQEVVRVQDMQVIARQGLIDLTD